MNPGSPERTRIGQYEWLEVTAISSVAMAKASHPHRQGEK